MNIEINIDIGAELPPSPQLEDYELLTINEYTDEEMERWEKWLSERKEKSNERRL